MSTPRDYLLNDEIIALADAGWYGREVNQWMPRVFDHHCNHHHAAIEVCDAAVCVKARAAEVAAYTELTTKATVHRILDWLEQEGFATWGCYTGEDAIACRAEAAEAITAILKDGR